MPLRLLLQQHAEPGDPVFKHGVSPSRLLKPRSIAYRLTPPDATLFNRPHSPRVGRCTQYCSCVTTSVPNEIAAILQQVYAGRVGSIG